MWVVASNLLLRLASVALTAVVAHILTKSDFGVYAVALTAYAIISSIGELGLSACLIRADLDIDELAPTVVTVSILSSAVFAGAMAVLAGPIATALGAADAVNPIRTLAIAVLLLGVFAVPTSQMARHFRQDKIFLANVIGFVPSTALLIILAKSGSGAMAFAWSMVARQLVVGLVLVVAAPRYYRPRLSRNALSLVLSFGVPLAAANFVNFSLLNVDYAVVGHLLGKALLGVYMLAFTIASWPSALLGSVINNVSMPAFSRVKHDPDLLKNAISTGLRGVMLIVMPMSAMMIALAQPLIPTLYGTRWAGAAQVLGVLALYSVAFMVCLLFANMLTGLGRSKALLILQLIWIGTLLPAMVIGVHQDKIVGAAYAHVAIIVPIVLPSYVLVIKRVTGVRLAALGRAVLPALLGSAAAAVAARAAADRFASPLAALFSGLAAGGLVYVIVAGQQLAAIFARGKIADRVLGVYGAAARLVGLPTDGRARHSARSAKGRVPDALAEAGPAGGGILVGQGGQLAADRVENLAFGGNVAYPYRQPGWAAQAIALHVRALAERERALGHDHPHTVASRTDLAHAYRRAGLLTKAISLYERVHADWKRLLGPDHPRTLRTGNYLAAAYCQAGRLDEAILIYEHNLDDRARLFGSRHPSTLRSCAYLARTYRQAGRVAEAIPLYERTLAGWRELRGSDDPRALTAGYQLAEAYREAGRLAEATDLGERTLARCRQVLGEDSLLTTKLRRSLRAVHDVAAREDPSGGASNPDRRARPVSHEKAAGIRR